MSKCDNCNNEITNNTAKFCENCGEFLELIDKEINLETKLSKNKTKEFEKILIESVHLKQNHTTDPQWYYELIMSNLIEFTNIETVFRKNEMKFIDIEYILQSLEQCSEDLILNEFLTKVNEFYELMKTTINLEYKNVIIYTNLDKKLKDKELFKTILNMFNLEIFEFDEFTFKEETEECNNFNSRFLMFKFSKKTRDDELIKYDALNEIYSFFGYLTYLNKFNKTTTKNHINELTLNNQVSDLECNTLIVTNDANEILRIGVQNEIITNSKKVRKSKINKIDSNSLIKDFTKYDKPKISNSIKEYFKLYYLAGNESILENSFLKYWALSEKILKEINGDMKGATLKKFMRKILKANKYPKYLIKRIELLYTKRNEFVHKNKHGEITQYDQSLIKVISERLIEFLINFIDKVDSKKDYGVILMYSNQPANDNEKLIKLIKLTIQYGDEK